MSLAAHLLMFLFAAPAGILTYLVHIAADHDRVDTRFLLAIILLLGIPLLGRPSMAAATMLYYAAGIALTATAVHGFTVGITAANYGLSNTLRGLANIIDDPATPQERRTRERTGRRQSPDEPPDQPQDTPIIWDDQ